MPSIIDVLLFEAALFILVVTGCFAYGAYQQAMDWKQESLVKEIESLSDERLEDAYWSIYLMGYPRNLVNAELNKRRKKRESITINEARELLGLPAFDYGILSVNEMRQIQINQASDNATVNAVQVANGNCNTNVIGSNNVVNCGCDDDGEWEEERFYSDDTLYLVRKPRVPDTYGTDERK